MLIWEPVSTLNVIGNRCWITGMSTNALSIFSLHSTLPTKYRQYQKVILANVLQNTLQKLHALILLSFLLFHLTENDSISYSTVFLWLCRFLIFYLYNQLPQNLSLSSFPFLALVCRLSHVCQRLLLGVTHGMNLNRSSGDRTQLLFIVLMAISY